jgi:hypothetical protein
MELSPYLALMLVPVFGDRLVNLLLVIIYWIVLVDLFLSLETEGALQPAVILRMLAEGLSSFLILKVVSGRLLVQ